MDGGDDDDDDVWARVFGGPPLPTVSYTASAANAAVDAVSRRPSSPTELGLDPANPSNSMGDGPTQQSTAFPRFGTRDVSSPTVVVACPGHFLSFATTPTPSRCWAERRIGIGRRPRQPRASDSCAQCLPDLRARAQSS